MNIQQTIITGIKEQLFCNDYLVLPDFGGFVLKTRASHFSASGGMLLPASKTVGFNAQLRQNDGVLALWLQNKLNCSPAQSLTHLHEFTQFCSGLLQAKRRLTLDGIGFFYLDFENNVCFEPQADVNFLTSSFGLGAISLQELPAEKETPLTETVFKDRVIAPEIVLPAVQKQKRNYRKVLVPILLGVLFFSTISLLVTNTQISGSLKSSLFNSGTKTTFNSIDYPELKLLNNQSENTAYVTDANGIASIELEGIKTLAVKVLEIPALAIENKKTSTLSNKTSLKGNFEIVLGCFSVLDNAKRMIRKLSAKQVEASISEQTHKGMHVVSIGKFQNKTEATEKLEQIKTDYPHAWIKAAQ